MRPTLFRAALNVKSPRISRIRRNLADINFVRDDRDYKLDLASLPPEEAAPAQHARPYISVLFACCGVYLRVYRSHDARRYTARCPRCAKPVNFIVGEGGTDCRVFRVE